MEENKISLEEETHIDHLEDEMDEVDEDEGFTYNCCCCRDDLVDELATRDRIRAAVMPGTMLYDGGDIRKMLMILSMYPAFATISEVVEDMCAHQNEAEC